MDLSPYQHDSDEFAHLSLHDLLEARELYHVYLVRHPNVVATALGRYRIRKGDSWPDEHGSGSIHQTGPRTIENSEVRPYSWPSILVFVDRWLDEAQFSGQTRASQDRYAGDTPERFRPDQKVPQFLFLPDGRRVPLCVMLAPAERAALPPSPVAPMFPLDNVGGGYPVYARVQGREHIATISCLVSDGHKIYALTNRHVVGARGEVLYSILDGETVRIGTAAAAQFKSVPFARMYPGFPDADLLVNLDVGMIELDDVERCSAKIAGIGEIGPMADYSAQSLSLSLIGCRVCGSGVGSGLMRGEIQALFYRYKSQGGFEYVADLMIGPRTAPLEKDITPPTPFETHPGDSGTLWTLEPFRPDQNGDMPLPLPLAVQWGQSTLVSGPEAKVQSFALATLLSRVCSMLEVDPIRDLNKDRPETWGDVGHFSIASRIAATLSDNVPKLAMLMKNNLEIISHKDDKIKSGQFGTMSTAPFVPMADVPDFVWKHGKQGFSRGAEGPNHFADMDQPRTDKKTLLALSKDKKFFDPDKWNAFYEQLTDADAGGKITWQHRGLLPFRVWQIFDEMAGFAADKKFDEFVCAAGVLAHYVGDACQPLHISFKHDGDPTQKTGGKSLGAGVHDVYESKMVGKIAGDILTGLDATPKVKKTELVKTGREAGLKTLDLMRQTFATLPPDDIIEAFANPGADKPVDALVKKCGPKTIQVMQDGVHLLAVLWESAWTLGKGEQGVASTASLMPGGAMSIIAKNTFLTSYSVGKIGAHLKGKPA